NLKDIERIEVLRGPQGTLFGKNASAGVINIVTQSPTETLSAYVEGSLTDDEEYRLNGMVSGPLGDIGGFRLDAYYSDFDGYMNNLTTGNKLGASESLGGRAKFLFELGDSADLTLIAEYIDEWNNAGSDLFYEVNPANDIDLTGIEPGVDNVNARINDEEVNDTEQTLLAAKLNVDLGFATFSSITSYQKWDYYFENDQDQSADPTIFQFGPYLAEQVTQEFRLTSPATERFDYLVGLYYADGETDRAFNREVPPFLSFLQQSWDSTAETTSYAAFAQIGYDITPTTHLIVGARINNEDIGVRFEDGRFSPPEVFEGSDSESAFTGKIALQHYLENDWMAFGSISTGYKGQAYDISSGFDQRRADNPIESEDSLNYEIGLKGQAWDGRAQLQFVAFLTDYDNFQAQGINNELIIPQFELTNVGELRTQGLEFDGTFFPTENLSVFASAAYIDAEVREFPNANCYFGQTEAEGCVLDPGSGQFVQDLAGGKLSNSPDLKFNVGFNYDRQISAGMGLFVSGNYSWQDDVNFSIEQNPRTVQESYGIANAEIGLQGRDGRWSVSIFANNLFDESYVSRIIDDTSDRAEPYILLKQTPRNLDRYFGGRVRIGF
ncbi:MAG: TonB-dependent receptor, partial [Planctomycetes bacterium]|nr:TonB-dependent receptor [Planctomycetota bacterium]